MEIISELKRIRNKHHTTINILSRDIGYDSAYISRVERGLVTPSINYVGDFMSYFGIMKEHPEYRRFVNEQKQIAIKQVENKYLNKVTIYTLD